jgi:hypothetical protein
MAIVELTFDKPADNEDDDDVWLSNVAEED